MWYKEIKALLLNNGYIKSIFGTNIFFMKAKNINTHINDEKRDLYILYTEWWVENDIWIKRKNKPLPFEFEIEVYLPEESETAYREIRSSIISQLHWDNGITFIRDDKFNFINDSCYILHVLWFTGFQFINKCCKNEN